jgi:hypothetical protein
MGGWVVGEEQRVGDDEDEDGDAVRWDDMCAFFINFLVRERSFGESEID